MPTTMRKSLVAALLAACCATPLLAGTPAYATPSGDNATPAVVEGESKYSELGAPAGATLRAQSALAAAPTPATPVFGPAIEGYAPNDPQDQCIEKEQAGPVALRALLNQTYDLHRAGNILRDCGQGDTSEHKEGRALDYMLNNNDASERAIANTVVDWMLATDGHGNKHAIARRMGLQYIIWNRQIWSSSRASEGWRNYTGDNPHTDHIHFSFGWPGARKETSWWTAAGRQFDSFSGDARADLVVHTGTDVGIRTGVSTGGFDAGTVPTTGWGRYHGMQVTNGLGQLFFADYNADHKTDMIVHDGTNISVRLNNGNGGFNSGTTVSSGWGRYHGLDVANGLGQLYFADYNADGFADMIVHDGTDISVRLNNKGAGFNSGTTVSSGWGRYHGMQITNGLGRLYFADYDGDGYDDMIVHDGTNVSVRLNNDGAGFDSGRNVTSGYGRYHGLQVPNGLGRLYFA
jgi:hypothetical protein